jgi:sulfonate transport system ATP-binding protein
MNAPLDAPLLDVHVPAKRFGGQLVLDNFALSVHSGQIVSLVGASGCGKSTLLRIIAGLDSAHDGRVLVDGVPARGVRRDVGFVFQEPRLLPWLSVAQNVGFDADPARARDPRVHALLEEVGLAHVPDALPKALSGGMAQRVAIARGLFNRPRLLLLDEPFSAVDAFTRMRLQDLLLSVAQEHGTTVLMVTHDVDEAAWLSDRVLVMGNGQVLDDIAVDAPRPRSRRAPALTDARNRILETLEAAHVV